MSTKGKTLKDLAAKLDISIATASRALAGHARIAPETRLRVAEAAREIGYVPNRAARALVSGRSGFAALALPVAGLGVGEPFMGEFVAGLTAGLGQAGLDLLLTTAPEDRTETAVIQELVESRRADGLIVARLEEEDPRVAYLLGVGAPFVAFGRLRDPGVAFPWVDTDGRAAFAEAFDLLYDLGHRRFALVSVDEPLTYRIHREGGVADAMARRADPGVTLERIAVSRFDAGRRAAAIRAMLDWPGRPTAVIGLFDGLAIAVLAEAERLGLAVPDALSVIGFDNTPEAPHARPGLTTFDAEIRGCAEAMAAMLAAVIADPTTPPATRLVRPTLVPRGSHGPA